MDFKELEQRICYAFRDKVFLERALTHSSYSYQHENEPSNERLEFLGDAVLELCISRILFDRYPDAGEGKLSILRSQLVSKRALIKIAMKIKLEKYLRLGPEMDQRSTGRRFLSSCVEALIGAIYLDSGLSSANEFILFLWQPLLSSLRFRQNYKNILQQDLQKSGRALPVYEMVAQEGTLTSPIFVIRLLIDGKEVSMGKARSKKVAEQIAALKFLRGRGK